MRRNHPARIAAWRRLAWAAALILPLSGPGCSVDDGSGGGGPGHREQTLALTPDQELALGREAYREILAEKRALPGDAPEVQRVRRVGRRIAAACEIGPLMREINLHVADYRFEWEFNVIEDDHVNAFCLPGGKVAVFSGLLDVAEDDDQLATVIGHEVAHALAHHASERLALAGYGDELRSAGFLLERLDRGTRGKLIGLLSAGAGLNSLAYGRFQESEADHIGVFLMAFAGYDPDEAVVFWRRMSALSREWGRLPEILSDHPSDARRIAQLEEWVPLAKGAKRAFDDGRIAPATGR